MLLKVQHVMDATLVVAAIINERRPMPQRGKYWLARLHAKLMVEFKIMDARRDEMIKVYNNPQTREVRTEDGSTHIETVEGEWQVPMDKMPEFTAAWKVIGDEEIEVDVQPIPLQSLSLPDGSDGSIEAAELITLGSLVYDSAA